MKPRHAISTLFPYTTLFRSASGDVSAEAADTPGHPQHSAALAPQDDHEGNEERRRRPSGPTRAHNRHGCKHGERDRKSTRLNSSHVDISYAVFCLKKKNSNLE